MCNFIHHFGMATALVAEGRMTEAEVEEVIDHFARVNRCTHDDFDAHYDACMKQWERRSAKKWTVDFGPYATEVAEAIRANQYRLRNAGPPR
jgi:hypothetical protein